MRWLREAIPGSPRGSLTENHGNTLLAAWGGGPGGLRAGCRCAPASSSDSQMRAAAKAQPPPPSPPLPPRRRRRGSSRAPQHIRKCRTHARCLALPTLRRARGHRHVRLRPRCLPAARLPLRIQQPAAGPLPDPSVRAGACAVARALVLGLTHTPCTPATRHAPNTPCTHPPHTQLSHDNALNDNSWNLLLELLGAKRQRNGCPVPLTLFAMRYHSSCAAGQAAIARGDELAMQARAGCPCIEAGRICGQLAPPTPSQAPRARRTFCSAAVCPPRRSRRPGCCPPQRRPTASRRPTPSPPPTPRPTTTLGTQSQGSPALKSRSP